MQPVPFGGFLVLLNTRSLTSCSYCRHHNAGISSYPSHTLRRVAKSPRNEKRLESQVTEIFPTLDNNSSRAKSNLRGNSRIEAALIVLYKLVEDWRRWVSWKKRNKRGLKVLYTNLPWPCLHYIWLRRKPRGLIAQAESKSLPGLAHWPKPAAR